MPSPKKNIGLGRGLNSILGDAKEANGLNNASVTTSISTIPIDKIEVNPYQPRKDFDEASLDELAQSIRQQGVIVPVTVREKGDGTFQLIAGERRYRASKKAGLQDIPAYIRVATDAQMMEMALVENIQRENLNAMEIAFSYKALIEECNLTHEQLSEKVGKNRSTITNYLRLLNLPAETQIALNAEEISMAHARALINVEDPETHIRILHEIIERHLSVHQVEMLIKATKDDNKKAKQAPKNELPERFQNHQLELRKRLQSEVDVRRSRRGKGTLTIHFNNDDDFERIMKLLNL